METTDVIQTLSSIPIGTIIAWVTVIVGIITAIVTGTIKLYKAFEKTHEMKEENLEFRKMVKDHDAQLKLINDKLSCIQDNLTKRDKADLKSMRYSIVRAGEEYVSMGKITIRQLRALEELFEDYHDKHGNGYVTTLMRKVRALPVIGRLDEDDNDIEDVE
ncbi:MAG: hypothetical protein IKO36_08490 [Bacteroidaceae bacterium]|nr:hypothetical protein [Bacteroidaceae bacterium]